MTRKPPWHVDPTSGIAMPQSPEEWKAFVKAHNLSNMYTFCFSAYRLTKALGWQRVAWATRRKRLWWRVRRLFARRML